MRCFKIALIVTIILSTLILIYDSGYAFPELQSDSFDRIQKFSDTVWGDDKEKNKELNVKSNGNTQNITCVKSETEESINEIEAINSSENSHEIVVAVIDDGVNINHPDLKDYIWENKKEIPNNNLDDDNNGYVDDIYGWDFLHNDNSVFDTPKEDFHATPIAGIIVSTQSGSAIVADTNVKIMSLKILGDKQCTTTEIIKAIKYAKLMGAKVINASWNIPENCNEILLNKCIKESGILFVTAAGNDGLDIDKHHIYPACLSAENIISVAAIDRKSQLWEWSNYGEKSVDIAALGERVLAVSVNAKKKSYYSGTSIACPYVTGISTLLLGYNRQLTPFQVKQIIMETGETRNCLDGKTVSGKIANVDNIIKIISKGEVK